MVSAGPRDEEGFGEVATSVAAASDACDARTGRFRALLRHHLGRPHECSTDRGLRPLYWWARDLRSRGDILTDVRFNIATKAATVTVQLASYQTLTVTRRADIAAALPSDLPTLIAEAIWRLGPSAGPPSCSRSSSCSGCKG